MADAELFKRVARAPKAELHVHIEGTLEPELVFELAQRNGVRLPYASVDDLRSAYRFDDLQSFLDLYYAAASVLKTEADFYAMAMAYFQRAVADAVVCAEVFFDPQTHTERGVAMATVVGGLQRAALDARARWGLSVQWILCFLRHLSEDQAFDTLDQALPFRSAFVGVGLDSSERGNPPSKFARVFERCRQLGLRTVAHAGEEGCSAYIEQALDLLHAQRIDHGVRCTDDPELVRRLVRLGTPLTVCPLSNVKLRVFDHMRDHNLPYLLDEGVCVTVNSDDPAYFGGYINDNYRALMDAHPNLGKKQLKQLLRNSLCSTWARADDQQRWLAQLDAVFDPG